MMPAVKHLDPVLGVDIHFIITPPGPVVPIPHPHIGIVFDPFDYLPIIGATVVVNGLPRAQAGTGGRTLPPHFPIGGVFAKPPGNENETFMGSSTVVVEDEPFTYMLLPVLSCQDIGMPSPPRKKGPSAKTLQLPTSIALSIPAGPPVIVGGPPTISMSGLMGKVAMAGLLKGLKKLRKLQKGSRKMKALSQRLHRKAARVMDKAGLGPRARDKVHKAICTLTGHPVDVVTGRVVTEVTDWELPGPIPLRFTRHYSSSLGWRNTGMGYGWNHSLDLAVWEEAGRVVYRAEDGREIEFDTTGLPKQRLEVGAELYAPMDRLTLRRVGEQRWEVESAEGLTHELRGVPGEARAGLCRVVRTRNRAGHVVEYEYDGRGHLRWVRDSAGRRVLFECDEAGHLLRVALPHPREPGQITHNQYVYSEAGHLLEARDAVGHALRYAYEGGLEVSRWMPGGVVATWKHDEAGLPTERRTLVGGGTVAQRTWRWRPEGQMAAMSDAAHGHTEYLHDAWGRLVGERRPDGSFQHRAMDAVGNLYRHPGMKDRRYGPGGRLREADGTQYTHDADGNLTAKHTPEGTWRYGWNGAGLLSEVQRPDGVRVQLEYDALARRTRKVVLGTESAGQPAPEREVRFIWDGHVPLHEVASSEDVTTWLFEPERFAPLAREDATGRYAVVTDHLGAPTEMYDELGQLAWRMQLDAFGVGKADVALKPCPWRWPGQYEDEETGLLYNRFRYYDAYAGRYISQDPLGLAAGPSLYGYPEDPLSATDPLGLSEQPCKVSAGKNFKDHYIRHKRHLEEMLKRKFPKWSESAEGLEFRSALQQLIESGQLQHQGMATINKGAAPAHVYEGLGITAVLKPGGEFVTLLESGVGRATPGAMQFVSSAVPGTLPW